MKVKQLIEELKGLDPEMEVVIPSEEAYKGQDRDFIYHTYRVNSTEEIDGALALHWERRSPHKSVGMDEIWMICQEFKANGKRLTKLDIIDEARLRFGHVSRDIVREFIKGALDGLD